MSQILIVDIQEDYKQWISSELERNIRESTKNYSSIVYLWDDINGSDLYSQMPSEWLEDELFYDSLNIITKQYGFFRNFMDAGLESEDIIKLAKFLIKHNLSDWREINDNEELLSKFNLAFKDSELLNYGFDNYSFSIPYDLIDSCSHLIKNGVVLVGGARHKCLKEISLLLDVLDISYTIDEELTYS